MLIYIYIYKNLSIKYEAQHKDGDQTKLAPSSVLKVKCSIYCCLYLLH